ncbi:glycosyltransferase family 39 protein [Dyella sp. 2HG41-7]|uniref:ArnT family glycosyltransferase n=1 Tax=Dyella sp. 2HG41-7 TaxID=2883239 RepID=UPI001F35BD78|nr:glycosyltransferase family 39 protein [Dyella sp. 2HG41-7]
MPNDRIMENRLWPNTEHATRWPLIALICFGLLLGFAFQGTRGLWSPDEGRYTVAALQMLDTGNYLAPAYSPDEVNFSKPPTTYWVIAASIKVFGRNSWAVRAPYALAYVLMLLIAYAIGRRLIPEKPWLPALIYGCALAPFVASNAVSTDAFLTVCEALAMLGFLRAAFDEREQGRKRYVLLMWIGWGLAFLTKGPPGLIPLLAIIPFIAHRDGWRGLGRFFPWSGIVLFLLIGLSWYLVVVVRYAGLLHYFLHQEVYNRIFTASHHRNAGWFGWIKIYVPVLGLGLLPWWPAVGRMIRRCASSAQWSEWKNNHAVESFLVLWFLIPFVLFCLVQSRLPLYMLPLFLPLALLLAFELRHRVDLRQTKQKVLLGVWMVVLLAVKAGAAYGVHSLNDNRIAAQELAAATHPERYQAIIFVENTPLDYTIEEATPWGLRMYLGKPVYGIPLLAPQGPEALCHALHNAGTALVVIDPDLGSEAIAPALTRCPGHVEDLGAWRKSPLKLIAL